MIRRPPRSTPFPSTTPFRSGRGPAWRPGSEKESPARTRWPSRRDRKSTRLNSSHLGTSYAVFCLKKKEGGWEIDRPVMVGPQQGERQPRAGGSLEYFFLKGAPPAAIPPFPLPVALQD